MRTRLIRNAMALAVAAMGAIDLVSALFSRLPERVLALRRLVPTDVLDTSRTFTLLAGALLVIAASGLRRGKRRAFVAALLLCAVSVIFNLLKALDVEEATAATALMFALGVSGHAFQVRSRALSFDAFRSRAMLFVVAFAVYAIGGCWLLEARLAPGHSLAHALQEVVYQLTGLGSPALQVPRSQRVVNWYLGSISVIGFTTLIGLALAALQPAAYQRRHRVETARVAELLREYGDNTISSFALDEDSDYFFSANRRAVIAYRYESDTLLVIGDPIGPPEEIPALLEDFQRLCHERDWQFAFYQARPERLGDYKRLGWRAIHIGEDPVLWTDRFTLEGAGLGAVRRSVRKLEREGLEVRMFVPGINPFDPYQDTDELLAQMTEISAEWLRGRPGGEKGFCMGRFDRERLPESWLAVAWNPGTGRVEAFCTWEPIWARRGWAIDLMRRRSDSLTGVSEFLVVKSVAHARERGDALLSLSLSALVKIEETLAPVVAAEAEEGGPEPTTVTEPDPEGRRAARGAITDDRAREFLMQHLARFYDFKNLFRWKKKFAPAFEDRYLVYPDPLGLPRVARALLRAQSPGGLMAYFRRAA